ncbi:hypothetical protein F4U94_16985 [Sphingobium limneticum]|nr:hypothetical protein F4U94_16985 [Sphingobium limneticum]
MEHRDNHAVLENARREARNMRRAVEGVDRTNFVRINVQKFEALSLLIDDLCKVISERSDHDMGGTRYWVPLPEFSKLRSSREALLSRCAALEANQNWQTALLPLDDWG